MNEDFQRAKLQGTLGALCLLVGSAAYSIKGEIAYLDSQILVWIFAFTFLYHALKNIQNITGPQVFIIFKYAYSIALAALLYFSAIYILRRCDCSRLQIYVPYLIFAVTVAWIIINFKLYAATECKLFSVYAALLIADIGTDIIYSMMFKIPAPAAITMDVINFMELLNLILNPLASVVLLLAWLNIKPPPKQRIYGAGRRDKISLAFYARAEFNLDRAGTFEKIKFHARMRCLSKTRPPKPARLIIYVAQALSRIGAILDIKI